MGNLLRAGRFGDHDGRARAFCDLKSAAAEGEKLSGFAARPLRVNADGYGALPQKRGGLPDRFQRLAVVLAVDGQKKALVYEAPRDRDIENFRLGYIGKLGARADGDGDERVKVGPVVGHQQKRRKTFQLFQPGAFNFDPPQTENEPHRLV